MKMRYAPGHYPYLGQPCAAALPREALEADTPERDALEHTYVLPPARVVTTVVTTAEGQLELLAVEAGLPQDADLYAAFAPR